MSYITTYTRNHFNPVHPEAEKIDSAESNAQVWQTEIDQKCLHHQRGSSPDPDVHLCQSGYHFYVAVSHQRKHNTQNRTKNKCENRYFHRHCASLEQ